MKNWIKQLRGGQASAAVPVAEAFADDDRAAGAAAGTDALYYRWLTATHGYPAPAEVETRILEGIAALAGQPDDAAGLVPRVPEAIPGLLASLDAEDVPVTELAHQLAQDLVLVAEAIREANSAYYRPIAPVRNAESAIMMLGQNGLRMLLARIAFRPLVTMQSGGFTQAAAPLLWTQSVNCALASSLMAPVLGLGVFEAYLAGLMQNVGMVVAFRVADQVCPGGQVPAAGDFGVRMLDASRQLSATIAAHWRFPAAVAGAIVQAGSPDRESLAEVLAQGDRIAKLRQLIDAGMLREDDELVTEGLDNFQRRCLGKLSQLDN